MEKNLIDESGKKESYSNIGNSDISWTMVADTLLFSSDLLYKHGVVKDGFNIYPVIQMLRGMSVECLLKVAVRYSGKSIVKDEEVILKTHDLLKLSTDTKIEFSKEEKNILEDLTTYIQCGRYPISSKMRDMEKTIKLINMIETSHNTITAKISIWPKDKEDNFKKLIEKLKMFLENPQNDHSEQK